MEAHTLASAVALSVIIPTLDEEERIGRTIERAFAAGAAEVIVSDGGSRDATVAVAQKHGARIVTEATIRSRQLNRGAEAAAHDALIFLHADTLLPSGAADAVVAAIEAGHQFGGFRIGFIEPGWRLRYVAFMVNARTRLTSAPWGDQAQFADRRAFLEAGGYREDLPLMEDYELAIRMKRIARPVILPLAVSTSGRRFLTRGVIRSSVINWWIIAGYHLGISPARLARWYRGS
jgi:rSAM/selenodomain-associated transferase 2